MTGTESATNRQRVRAALAKLLEADQNGNSYLYFRASDLQEVDPGISAAMAGSHLPEIEAESPLSDGLIVERYTDSRCGPTLWIVKRNAE